VTLHRPSPSFAIVAILIVATILTALGTISQQALDYVFLGSVAWALFNTFRKAALRPLPAAGIAVGIAGALAGLQVWQPSLQFMPYLVIAPANLAMAYFFARGLFPGRQPVLLQLIRAMGKGPVDDPRFRRFVASQCLLWSLMTFATACLAFVAMVSKSAWPWLPGALTNLIMIQIAWFVLSHYYASLRYNRPETWCNTLRAMTRPGIWSSLRA
jgi:hypothetical protein